jgi:hypothetical protein
MFQLRLLFPCGAYGMLKGRIWRMRILSAVTEILCDADGDFSLARTRTPTHSQPDVNTGRGTPRSLYTLLGVSLSCLLRVWLFALGTGESSNLGPSLYACSLNKA